MKGVGQLSFSFGVRRSPDGDSVFDCLVKRKSIGTDWRVPRIVLVWEHLLVRAYYFVLLLVGRYFDRVRGRSVDRGACCLLASAGLIRYTTSWPVRGMIMTVVFFRTIPLINFPPDIYGLSDILSCPYSHIKFSFTFLTAFLCPLYLPFLKCLVFFSVFALSLLSLTCYFCCYLFFLVLPRSTLLFPFLICPCLFWEL